MIEMGGVSTEALDAEMYALGRWLSAQADACRVGEYQTGADAFTARLEFLLEYMRRSEATIAAHRSTIKKLESGQIAFRGSLKDGVWIKDEKPYGTYDAALAAAVG